MKIEFKKQISGDERLDGYFTRGEPVKDSLQAQDFYSKILLYDLRQLECDLVDKIEEQFAEYISQTAARTGHSSLCVTEPDLLTLELHAEEGSFLRNKYQEVGKLTEGKVWKKERIHYQEVPQVLVTGRIDYDKPFGNTPNEELSILNNLGYGAIVTTTLRQVETMLDTLTVSVPELSKRSF